MLASVLNRSDCPISSADGFRKLGEALEKLYRPLQMPDFPQRALDALEHLLPYCGLDYGELDLRTGQLDAWRNYPVPMALGDFTQIQKEVVRDNPVVDYLQKDGKERVLKITDLITFRQFKKTGLYSRIARPCGFGHMICVSIPQPKGRCVGFGVNWDRDFSEEHRQLLQILAPHLAQARENARLMSSLSGPYPPVDFTNLRRLGMTQRQCEVLYWLANGKRDKEIAVILSVSVRTVNHHVATILGKLGVETRTAAAVKAADLL